MDASNPVISTDRVKMSELHSKAGLVRRQNLRLLDQLSATSKRVFLHEAPEYQAENYSEYMAHAAKGTAAGASMANATLPFLLARPPIPVDNETHHGSQIHPPGTNMKNGFVSTTRVFGNVGGIDDVLAMGAATMFPSQQMIETRAATQFSGGRAEGFIHRLKKLCTRDCRSPYKAEQVAKLLEKLLPVRRDELPDWKDFPALYQNVEITFSSGAGAPYWKSKLQAQLEMYETVLPLVTKAIERGEEGLRALQTEHPEWFLTECKNKRDRYATDRLDEKCRPYFNQPYHFSVLFSMIVQPFCNALELWDKHPTTYNAYGFSAVGGGLDRIVEEVRRLSRKAADTGKSRVKIGCYGDDGKIIMCETDGSVVCVDPDFSQMDGSVDYETVRGVCLYIRNCYSSVHGENSFWEGVLNLLVREATNPPFIVEGTTVYNKKQRDGILSGVVGTTLFDTAKAALAYHDIKEQLVAGTLSLKNETKASEFLLKYHGLEVKKGTWTPVPFDISPDADLVCTNKFLGMQWQRWHKSSEESTVVTVLPDDDWLSLMLVPRNDSENMSGRSKMTPFQTSRRSFDRIRGLLITGGIFSERVRKALYSSIDALPGSVILATVQSGEGKGEFITENITVNKGTVYPTSSGYPTIDWAYDLFKFGDPGSMPEIFPDIFQEKNFVSERLRRAQSERVAMLEIQDRGGEPVLDLESLRPLEPPPGFRDVDLPERVMLAKPVLPKAPPPLPPRKPRPLQDNSEYWAQKSVHITTDGRAFVPIDPLPPVVPRAPYVRGPHMGAVVNVRKRTEVDMSVILERLKENHKRSTSVHYQYNPSNDPKANLNAILGKNGFSSAFLNSFVAYDDDGLAVNRTELFVSPKPNLSRRELFNPFLGGQIMAWKEGTTKYGTLQGEIATEVLERILHFGMILYNNPGCYESRPPDPSTSILNPFKPPLFQISVKNPILEPHPDPSTERVYMDLGEGYDWSRCVDIDEDLKQYEKVPTGATPKVINILQHDIREALTTPYERERDAKPKPEVRNPKEKCPLPFTKPSLSTKEERKERRRQRRDGPRGGPPVSGTSCVRGHSPGRD